MNQEFVWSKETWESSISSRCWWFTPYGDGWAALPDDPELKRIVSLEQSLESVPEWAVKIVETGINFLPACGHYRFPLAYIEAIKAIGSETPPKMVHGCFTVDANQKRKAQDYCLCLDAWLAGAEPEAVARELTDMGHRKTDWNAVCCNLWKVLSEHSEQKDLLVERLLHHLRWWIKCSVWDDDLACNFGHDTFVGNYAPRGGIPGDNCYFDRPIPKFDQQMSPRVKRLEERLGQVGPLWQELRPWILEEWWLCAPKAFRFLERIVWQIGHEKRLDPGTSVPDFLLVGDTCPSQEEASEWWQSFCLALQAWSRGESERGEVAGHVCLWLSEPSSVKQWLVAVFLRKVHLYEQWKLGKLVADYSRHFRGSNPIRPYTEGNTAT